jgi:hypothetical protein
LRRLIYYAYRRIRLWLKTNKTNRCTEFQFYWYDDSTCFGQRFCPSLGVLSRTSTLVHYMHLWYIICICSDRMLPGVGWRCSAGYHFTRVAVLASDIISEALSGTRGNQNYHFRHYMLLLFTFDWSFSKI